MSFLNLAEIILIQSTVIIALIYFIRFAAGRKINSAAQYGLWFVLMFRLFIPVNIKSPVSIYGIVPKLSKLLPENSDAARSAMSNIGQTVGANSQLRRIINSGSVQNVVPSNQIHSGLSIEQIIILIWASGAVFFAIYYLICKLRIKKLIKKRKVPADSHVSLIFKNVCCDLKLKKQPELVIQNAVTVPALFGLMKPAVLFPESLLKSTKDSDYRGIFLHELTHYKYRDNIISTFMILARIIYWFDPLVWLAMKSMKHDGELCCDSRVMSVMDRHERIAYGKTLINIAAFSPSRMLNADIVGLVEKSDIGRRIIRIRNYKKHGRFVSVLSAVLIVLLAAGTLTGAADISPAAKTLSNHGSLSESVRTKTAVFSSDCSATGGKTHGRLTVYTQSGENDIVELRSGIGQIAKADTGLKGRIAEAEFADLTGDGADEIILVFDTGKARQMLVYTYENGRLENLPVSIDGLCWISIKCTDKSIQKILKKVLSEKENLSLSELLFNYTVSLKDAPFKLCYRNVSEPQLVDGGMFEVKNRNAEKGQNGKYVTELIFDKNNVDYFNKLLAETEK